MKRHINKARWYEYSVSSSIMIVLIAMLVGVYDLSSLILIFCLNACMILFGYMMELHNQTTSSTDWTAFGFGCFAGAVPWVVIILYTVGGQPGSEHIGTQLRLWHHDLTVHLLQQLRGKHAVAIQARRALARLPVRRAEVHRLEPGGQISAGMADVLRHHARSE